MGSHFVAASDPDCVGRPALRGREARPNSDPGHLSTALVNDGAMEAGALRRGAPVCWEQNRGNVKLQVHIPAFQDEPRHHRDRQTVPIFR